MKTCMKRMMIRLLKDEKIMKLFVKKVVELVDIGEPNLCGQFKDAILRACDRVNGKKKSRSKRDAWWCNEEVKEAKSRR